MPKKILIDTDPGIDDAMAIHMAFAHPDLEVVALTTVFGNVHVPVATVNALRLVEMAGADCPVAEGADRPLVQPLNPPAYFVHGDHGFGDVPAERPGRDSDMRTAARLIVDMINENPGEIWLCPVGPLTNIALALRLDPSITSKVPGVVIMGGAVDCPGNVTQWAEANIWNDPHAAHEVLAADWPVTLVGLDVTEKARCTPEDFLDLAQASPDIGGFLNAAVQFYFDWHRQKEVTQPPVPRQRILQNVDDVLSADPGRAQQFGVAAVGIAQGEHDPKGEKDPLRHAPSAAGIVSCTMT